MRRSRALPQSEVIRQLNPIIRGWAHYDRIGVSKAVYARLDALTWVKRRSWAHRRHPTTTTPWVRQRSWHRLGTRLTVATSATAPQAGHLHTHSEVPITRHSKVRGTRSPYDGEWVYGSTRQGRHPGVSPRLAMLLKQQRGRCASCGLFFHSEDRIESDHIDGDRRNARATNLQALHGHCHDAKTREHRDSLPHGMRDQHQDTEERSARQRARSVLEQREVERSASRL
jgi:RNA-directed DNA polymerase